MADDTCSLPMPKKLIFPAFDGALLAICMVISDIFLLFFGLQSSLGGVNPLCELLGSV